MQFIKRIREQREAEFAQLRYIGRMRKPILLVLLVTSIAQAAPKAPAPAASPAPSPSSPTSPRPGIHPAAIEGDRVMRDRKNPESAKKGLELFRTAFKEDPKNPEHGWRLSMACYFVGNRLTPNEKDKEKIFAEGRDAGKKAAEVDPKCAPCQFWTAINMALYGDTVGVMKMLFTLDEIQTRLKKVIELDPSYVGSGAYRLLGIIQWKVPGILGGSDKRAREYLEKSIELSPNETLNYLFLARLLKDSFDDPAAAGAIARRGLAVPADKLERIESIEAVEDLKKFVGSSTP